MSPKKNLKFDGYIRVSRTGGREGDSFRSPVEQRETIERLALAQRLELGEIVEEYDVSGKRKIERRELGRLVQKIVDGSSGGLIVWKVSRMSRDQVDGIITARDIRDAGGRIVGSDLDTSAPMGHALLGFLLGWAEEELEARKADWKSSQKAARGRGVFITSRIPFGYEQTVAGHAKKGDAIQGPLAQHPEHAALVEQVFRRRAAGASFQDVCDWLEEQGARTPKLGNGNGKGNIGGGNRWLEQSLRKLVRNPIYKGEPRGGDDMPEDARAALKIVSARLWERAQASPVVRAARSPDGALLAGLVHCGVCWSVMTPSWTRKKNGLKVRMYRCRNRAVNAPKCPAPMVLSANLLEPYIVDAALTRLHATGEFKHEHSSDEELEPLREAVADAIHDREQFEATALEEGLKPADVARMFARYSGAVEEAHDALREAQERAEVHTDVFSEAAGREAFEAATTQKQRAVMREVFDGITVRRGREPIAERVELAWKREGSCAACGALLAESAACVACGIQLQ